MKLTLKTALLAIEEISASTQSTDPRKSWKESHDAICEIYKIAHAARKPKCMFAHPDWGKNPGDIYGKPKYIWRKPKNIFMVNRRIIDRPTKTGDSK